MPFIEDEIKKLFDKAKAKGYSMKELCDIANNGVDEKDQIDYFELSRWKNGDLSPALLKFQRIHATVFKKKGKP